MAINQIIYQKHYVKYMNTEQLNGIAEMEYVSDSSFHLCSYHFSSKKKNKKKPNTKKPTTLRKRSLAFFEILDKQPVSVLWGNTVI